jgi:outer membrane protein TolC
LIDTIIRSQQLALLALIEHKEAGRGSELAVQQFIAQSKNLEILQNGISIEISKLENYINLLMGRYPQKIYTKQGVSDYEIKKLNTAGIPSQILENRPDIKMAYWELEKNKCNVEIVKSKFLPSFTISSSLGFQAFNPQFLIQSPTSMAYNLLGNISAPLINRGAIKADFKRASSSQLESMYQYQKIILTSYVEIVDRLNHINILESNLILREERVNALSKAVEASSELFKSSKANYLELLFVRQAELDAQWELLSNYSDLVIEEIQLYRSLGGFTLIN